MTTFADMAWAAGREDCAAAFDGDAVPTAEDLRETAERRVTDLLSESEADAFAQCVDAYVAGYQCRAHTLVAGWRKRFSDDD